MGSIPAASENLQGDSVSRIDPVTNHVTATIATQAEPACSTAAGGAVWVTNFDGDSLTRIDPATNHTREVKVCFGPAGHHGGRQRAVGRLPAGAPTRAADGLLSSSPHPMCRLP